MSSPYTWLRFSGVEKIVAINDGDGEIVLPLVRRTESQANVIGLLGPPAPDSEDGLEGGHQVGQVHLRNLSGYRPEFEVRNMNISSRLRVARNQVYRKVRSIRGAREAMLSAEPAAALPHAMARSLSRANSETVLGHVRRPS